MAAVKLLLSRKYGDILTCCLPCCRCFKYSGEGDINVLRQVLHPLFQNTMKKHILKTCFLKFKDKHHDHIYTFNAYDTDVFRIPAYCLDRCFFLETFPPLPSTVIHLFFHRSFFFCVNVPHPGLSGNLPTGLGHLVPMDVDSCGLCVTSDDNRMSL